MFKKVMAKAKALSAKSIEKTLEATERAREASKPMLDKARDASEKALDKARPALERARDATGRALLARGALDQWVEVWERVRGLARDADRVHLDRKQVVIAAFGALATAPRR